MVDAFPFLAIYDALHHGNVAPLVNRMHEKPSEVVVNSVI
jgi:hypothetical protein